MKLRKFKFFVILFFCTHSASLFSQKITLNITGLNSSNGLSQNTIQCIIKDKYGFMWFGTQDGLNKYDGFKFVVYKHLTNNSKTLPANNIISICEDADGNIWVGTRLGGLSKYNRADDSFSTFQFNSLNSHSISNNNITFIYKDKRANLWIGTENGLNWYDKSTGSFKRYFSNSNDTASLSNSNIYSIYEDNSSHLWIGTANGINLFNSSTGKCIRFTDEAASRAANYVSSIVSDASGNIWIGTSKGLGLLDKIHHRFSYYGINPDKNSVGAVNPIYALIKTVNNRFWVGSNTTLQLFDASSKKLIQIDDKSDADNPMPNDGVLALFEDNEGILWIGTSSEGVSKYDKNLSIFPAYKESLTNTPSAKNIVRGITEDKKGNLYLATDVGLEYFNRLNNSSKHYTHNFTSKNSLASNYTSSVLINKKNDAVWIGTYSCGLDCFNPHTGYFRHYVKGNRRDNIASNAIYALLEDHTGNVWIGSDEGGLTKYNPSTNTFTKYLHDKKMRNSLSDNTIEALYEDKLGNIWAGGYSNGVSVLNPFTGHFTQINSRNSNLSSNIISTFYEDARGNMWIGTMEGGLNCYNLQSHTIKVYDERKGLINSTVNYITGDLKGYLWLSTLQGITRFDPVHETYKNFGSHNGLKSMEFNLGTGAKLKTGEMAFGNINGFTIVDPEKLAYNNNKPPVAITGFELFNKPVVNRAPNSILKQNILVTKEITLNYSQSVFTLEFAALDYTIPESNTYAYRLDGFDKEWQFVGTQRKATYTNLDPGTYTFSVKAANNDGLWNERATTFKINIIAPFWMTWWFRGGLVLLLITSVWLFFLFRMRFMKKQREELENQVKSRTREIGQQAFNLQILNVELQSQKEALQTQSEELQAQSEELLTQQEELHEKTNTLELLNIELTNQKTQEANARIMAEKARQEADKANLAKSTFLATMSHEIRTPMNGVLGMASLLSETKLDNEQREYTDAIVNSGESLLIVINDILDFSKIESGNLELDPHDFDLRKSIEDVLELFASKAADIGIDLVYQIEDIIPPHVIADGLRLRQVLTNLIGNAIKFTHRGEVFIMVTASKVDGEEFDLRFEIRDTGIGIPENQLGKLFQAFNQVDSSVTRKYGGTGLGLVICERLVNLMGGTITVESTYGVGSTFSFYIKTKKGEDSALKQHYEANVCEGKKALVIDDNDTNLRIIKIQLGKWKMNVTAVSSGKDALEALSTQKDFDLIITDMQMPDMDGIRLSTQIKAIQPDIPIVLLSSIGNENKKIHPHLFASVLTKPVKHQQLYEVIALSIKKETSFKTENKKSLLSEKFASEYPLTVLIAEDNLMNQKLIMRILNKLGYQPDLANDGQEVLDLMENKTYDLVLMDMQMPNIDGLEATRIIREKYGARPLIAAMTANAMSEDKDECFKAGMNDYMAKPINIEILMNKLMDLYKVVAIDQVSARFNG